MAGSVSHAGTVLPTAKIDVRSYAQKEKISFVLRVGWSLFSSLSAWSIKIENDTPAESILMRFY
jgi:hypothetical protein